MRQPMNPSMMGKACDIDPDSGVAQTQAVWHGCMAPPHPLDRVRCEADTEAGSRPASDPTNRCPVNSLGWGFCPFDAPSFTAQPFVKSCKSNGNSGCHFVCPGGIRRPLRKMWVFPHLTDIAMPCLMQDLPVRIRNRNVFNQVEHDDR